MARIKSKEAIDESMKELRQRLSEQTLPLYRTVDGDDIVWHSSPAGSDVALQRFLASRKGDVVAAMKMYVAHLEWRSRIFPIPKTGLIAELIDEGRRFLQLTPEPDGCAILLINFLFGHFATENVSEVDLVMASLRFVEDVLASMESRHAYQLSCLVVGCPPPVPWSHVMVQFLQNNYPERLKLALIYPVPPRFVPLVRSVMWFVDENTRAKIDVECAEGPVLERFKYRLDQLPENLRGGFEGIVDRWKPDGNKLLRIAYSFLWPHRKEVSELEEKLYAAASQSSQHKQPLRPSAESWFTSSWSCCIQRPKIASETIFDSRLAHHNEHVSGSGRSSNDRKNYDDSNVSARMWTFRILLFVLVLPPLVSFFNYIVYSSPPVAPRRGFGVEV